MFTVFLLSSVSSFKSSKQTNTELNLYLKLLLADIMDPAFYKVNHYITEWHLYFSLNLKKKWK